MAESYMGSITPCSNKKEVGIYYREIIRQDSIIIIRNIFKRDSMYCDGNPTTSLPSTIIMDTTYSTYKLENNKLVCKIPQLGDLENGAFPERIGDTAQCLGRTLTTGDNFLIGNTIIKTAQINDSYNTDSLIFQFGENIGLVRINSNTKYCGEYGIPESHSFYSLLLQGTNLLTSAEHGKTSNNNQKIRMAHIRPFPAYSFVSIYFDVFLNDLPQIYSLDGKFLGNANKKTEHIYTWQIDRHPNGFYFLRYSFNNNFYFEKILLQK
jgi:hypothetical protein